MQRYSKSILIAVAVLILTVFLFTKAQPKVAELYSVEKNLSTKTTESADLERQLETLKTEATKKEMSMSTALKKIYKPEVPGVDAEASFTLMFDDLIEMAKYNGVKIYSVEYVYNPETDEFVVGAKDKFNVCQLNMQVIGDYSDLETFFQEIYRYPYLVNFDKIELVPYEKNKAIIIGKIQIKLYSSK